MPQIKYWGPGPAHRCRGRDKVQSLGGRWLSINGRVLHAAKVAASETYNTALEHHLTTFLGVRFAGRPGGNRSKRPVRKIVGVDPRLNQRWSHGERSSTSAGPNSPPTSPVILAGRGGPVEMLHLAQQATLETRERKHEPRTVTEQRAVWRTEAVETLPATTRSRSCCSRR